MTHSAETDRQRDQAWIEADRAENERRANVWPITATEVLESRRAYLLKVNREFREHPVIREQHARIEAMCSAVADRLLRQGL